MNKDQIKGTATNLTGKVQAAAGRAIDDKEMQTKGLHKQVVGTAEKAIGDAKQGVKDLSNANKHLNK